jgi:hypothetical protein
MSQLYLGQTLFSRIQQEDSKEVKSVSLNVERKKVFSFGIVYYLMKDCSTKMRNQGRRIVFAMTAFVLDVV